ncbi:hypothetical protein ACFLQJ_00825 [Calditrichota bacterium]
MDAYVEVVYMDGIIEGRVSGIEVDKFLEIVPRAKIKMPAERIAWREIN